MVIGTTVTSQQSSNSVTTSCVRFYKNTGQFSIDAGTIDFDCGVFGLFFFCKTIAAGKKCGIWTTRSDPSTPRGRQMVRQRHRRRDAGDRATPLRPARRGSVDAGRRQTTEARVLIKAKTHPFFLIKKHGPVSHDFHWLSLVKSPSMIQLDFERILMGFTRLKIIIPHHNHSPSSRWRATEFLAQFYYCVGWNLCGFRRPATSYHDCGRSVKRRNRLNFDIGRSSPAPRWSFGRTRGSRAASHLASFFIIPVALPVGPIRFHLVRTWFDSIPFDDHIVS